MRNLKRALSLGLASVMVIGMMATGAGAVSYDDLTDKDEIVNKEAVQMLVELGVINGKDDGSYDPTGIVTRAEMAKMICVVLNGGKDPNLGTAVTNSYTDTVGHWAAGYIEYCTQLGIVAGDGTGKFNPSATVTGSEAAKMLLVAMGYKSEIEGFTGANWALPVNTRASQKGLYDGLSINADAGLSRDNAAQMIYNALDASIVEYTYTLVTDGSSLSSSPTLKDKVNSDGYNVTLLEDRFNAVKVEGIVTGNEYATLTASATKGSAMDEGKTRIEVTNHDDQGYYKDGATTFTVSTGLEDLGRSVILFVKKDPNASKAQVFGSAVESGDNLVVKDTSTDTIKEVADDNDLNFDDAAQIAYNYGSLTELTSGVRDNEWDRGTEKYLIDNDDDGDVDYVLVNTMYFGQVSKYSTKDDGSITIDINRAWKDGDTASNLTADDKADVVGFDDVAEDDYVMAGWIGGKLYVEKAESVTGTLESLKKGESLTVDGTKYSVSEVAGYTGGDTSIVAASTVGSEYLDTEATYYLDANGLIVAVGDATENSGNYAYVWAIDNNSTIDDGRVKVTLQDGTTATYNLDGDSDITANLEADVTESTNRIYAYTLKDNTIKLTDAKNGNASSDASDVEFSKGKTTVSNLDASGKGKTNYASSSTVFFYVSLKSDKKTIDDVDVYTGYANAPSVEKVAAEAAYNNAGKMAAVAFEGGNVSIKDVADFLYITKIVSNSSDYSTVEAVLAGTDEAVEIRVNDSDLDSGDANEVYLYTVDTDGNYDLKLASSNLDSENYVADADVASISSTTVVVTGTGKGEYKVTDDTVWVEQKSNGKFDAASLGKLPANGDRGTVTTMLYNSDDEILLIVTKAAASQTETEIPEGINVDLSNRDEIAITWTGEKAPTEDQLYAAVVAEIEKDGYAVDKVENKTGKEYVITAVKGNLTRTYKVDLADATQVVTAKAVVSFKASAGDLTGENWTGVTEDATLSIKVKLASGQTATVKVEGATNGSTDFSTATAVNSESETVIYTAGSTTTDTLTVTVTVSQSGYAANTQSFTVNVAAA